MSASAAAIAGECMDQFPAPSLAPKRPSHSTYSTRHSTMYPPGPASTSAQVTTRPAGYSRSTMLSCFLFADTREERHNWKRKKSGSDFGSLSRIMFHLRYAVTAIASQSSRHTRLGALGRYGFDPSLALPVPCRRRTSEDESSVVGLAWRHREERTGHRRG